MSGKPVGYEESHPPHGHPDNQGANTQRADKPSTASKPPEGKPDPTVTAPHPKSHPPFGNTGGAIQDAAKGGQSAASAASSSELARLKVNLRNGLKQYPDFPSKGVLFEDIMPLFANHALHSRLIRALELLCAEAFNTQIGEASDIDVLVGLESRGFLFGTTLAVRLGAGFVPVRKKGKLPGEVETATYKKEYGEDVFEAQKGSIKPGQKVVIVDDIIATGGSAAAAGQLVRKLGGTLLGYVFMLELDFLKGREKLDAPVYTLLTSQEEGMKESSLEEKLPLGLTKESSSQPPRPVTDAGGSAAEHKP